jgi:hypothetical protein
MRMEKVLELHPTQFALGFEQVKHKVRTMGALSKKRLAECLHENKVPIVIGPTGEKYLIDHHHFLYACGELGIAEVEVTVECDLSKSKLSYRRFWQTMRRSHWTYLYDQFGEGPRHPLYLPTNVRGMADDPYRSLAWAVREAGGYEQSDETFAEFQWADLFRKADLLGEHGRDSMKAAVKAGVKLAHSKAARHLPGYAGRREPLPPVKKDKRDHTAPPEPR